ncbi:MAG: hypothetical protein AAGP08_05930 [Pseudomonadota bacterium]
MGRALAAPLPHVKARAPVPIHRGSAKLASDDRGRMMEDRTKGFGWGWVGLVSLVLLATMVALWWRYDCCSLANETPLSDQATVEAKLAEAGSDALYRLPTGIFVSSLAFSDAHDVDITGRIWQRIPAGAPLPEGAAPGILFPDAVSKHDDNLVPLYEDVPLADGSRLYVWVFQVTLREFFVYDDYPLDGKLVWIRLWTNDLMDRVQLVPDLTSYASAEPQDLIGVSDQLVGGEWSKLASYFSYDQVTYRTTFGRVPAAEASPGPARPELLFNVMLRRDFTDAFVVNLVPLFVTFGLLFGLMITVTRSREKAEQTGFHTLAVFGSCAGLFFIVLVSHIQLRQEFAGSQIVYIEYFYIVSYVALLIVSLFSFSVTRGTEDHPSWLLRHDGLHMKQLFWPVLLGVMLLITVWQLVWHMP